MTPYTYIASPDFINKLTFDHVETYSFQRGIEFEENRKLIQSEFDRLKVQKNKLNNLTKDEDEKFLELHGLLGFTQYLINDKGHFHSSSKKTNTFKHDDPAIDKIKMILRTEIIEIPSWLCAPVYRDAIVFYDNDNKIITPLNICLGYQYMETTMFNHINGDYKIYDLLKRFFIDIGHDIEDPDYFALDDINKMKLKYNK
jgi:hypothetical protein